VFYIGCINNSNNNNNNGQQGGENDGDTMDPITLMFFWVLGSDPLFLALSLPLHSPSAAASAGAGACQIYITLYISYINIYIDFYRSYLLYLLAGLGFSLFIIWARWCQPKSDSNLSLDISSISSLFFSLDMGWPFSCPFLINFCWFV